LGRLKEIVPFNFENFFSNPPASYQALSAVFLLCHFHKPYGIEHQYCAVFRIGIESV
jgi:hypothetical protein